MRSRDRILRAMLIGALIGAVLALAIYGEYRSAVAAGASPAGAGLGAGAMAWFASFPLGLLTLDGLVIPLLSLFHYQDSRASNIALISLFGVIANWTLLGALVGAVLVRRSAPHAI